MNKKLFASSTILSLTFFCQAAFADSTKQVSKEDLAAIQQGYLLKHTERAQPRRSALFAHILDSLANSSTMAKADSTPGLRLDSNDHLTESAVL